MTFNLFDAKNLICSRKHGRPRVAAKLFFFVISRNFEFRVSQKCPRISRKFTKHEIKMWANFSQLRGQREVVVCGQEGCEKRGGRYKKNLVRLSPELRFWPLIINFCLYLLNLPFFNLC